MSKTSHAKTAAKNGHQGEYVLRLFIAGNGQNSQKALVNLRSLCQEHLEGRFTIEIVDVVEDFQAAVRDNILVTLALILVAPLPRVVVLGNLNDQKKVLFALRVLEGNS